MRLFVSHNLEYVLIIAHFGKKVNTFYAFSDKKSNILPIIY